MQYIEPFTPFVLWSFFISAIVVQLLMIGLVGTERHGSFVKTQSGKTETFTASCTAGFIWWLVAFIFLSPVIHHLEKTGQTALIWGLLFISFVASIFLSGMITQFISRKLYKDVQFATIFDDV